MADREDRPPQRSPLAGDQLQGAKAIAGYLGAGWTERRVYHVAEHGTAPIWREPGVGLMALKSQLDDYFLGKARAAVERSGRAA